MVWGLFVLEVNFDDKVIINELFWEIYIVKGVLGIFDNIVFFI